MNQKLEDISNRLGLNERGNEGANIASDLEAATEKIQGMTTDLYFEKIPFILAWEDFIKNVNQAGFTDKDYAYSEIKGEKILQKSINFSSKNGYSAGLNPTEFSVLSLIDQPDDIVAIKYEFGLKDTDNTDLGKFRDIFSKSVFGSNGSVVILERHEKALAQDASDEFSIHKKDELNGFVIDSSVIKPLSH